DAVNGSQLFATNTAVNNMTNGKVGPFVSDNSVTSTQPVSSGADALAGGFGASATGAASSVIGNSATDNGVANSTVVGQGASIASGMTGSNVAIGQGSSVTAAAVPTSGATIGGTAYTFAGATPAGVFSVGTAGNERQITNVAAGQLSGTSTDAVNGSQLFATNQQVTSNTTAITNINNGGGIKYFHSNST
ncbi:calcium-binding protein, partial [Agrobacterium rhizogenes]|nr:calcium-binding protein [Rhizobium rhizogenes]